MADNLVLGRGKVFFAPYAFGATTGGTKAFLGNVPSFSIAQTNTKLEHYSSQGGLKIKDRSIVLQTDLTITFDTDNIDLGNLALWFGGNNTEAEPSDAPVDLGSVAIIGSSQALYGALFFESDNPVGTNANFWFPYVNLSPNGNYALIGDTWQTLSFTAEALKRDNLTQRSYTYGAGSTSYAALDDTAQLTVADVAVASSGANPATGGTVVESDTTQVHGVSFPFTYTLTGGEQGWVYAHNGTVLVGSGVFVGGASGTGHIVIAAASTATLKLYNNPNGTGTALATSASITVS